MPLVTVFGRLGGIGRQVVKLLAQRGDQVRVAVRNPQAALLLKPMGDVGQITPEHPQFGIREVGGRRRGSGRQLGRHSD